MGEVNRMSDLRRMLWLAGMCALVGCRSMDLGAPASSGPVAFVRVSLATALVEPFDTAPISVDIRDAQNRPAGTAADASWQSSDTSIASVSRGFLVTHAPGDVTITATVGGVAGSTIAHVGWRPDTHLFIGGPRVSLDVGAHVLLAPRLLGSTSHAELAARSVDWSSSNPLVAGVDAQGGVTAFATGTATLIARCLGLIDSMSVDVGTPKPGFAYFYSGDAAVYDTYDATYWTPASGKSFTTEGFVSAMWDLPYPGLPDLGWTGPGRPARDAVLHAISLDSSLCAAYLQPDSGFQFVSAGVPLVECRDSNFPAYEQSVKMELVAFRPAEFTGTLALLRPDWPAISTNTGGITQTGMTPDSRSYAMPGVSRDSLFWFVTAGASDVAGCHVAPSEATSPQAAVRVICDFFPFAATDPRFYAVGFGADARRGSNPIGFAEIGNTGAVRRKVVDGVDITATRTSSRTTDVVVSGDRLTAFDRIPAVLVTAIASNSARCGISEPSRPTPTTLKLVVTCTENVSGFTLGVVY
jgi:hypothetical protein